MAQPGWYPDPAGGNGMRWFDGVNWTQHVQPVPAPMPVQRPVYQPMPVQQPMPVYQSMPVQQQQPQQQFQQQPQQQTQQQYQQFQQSSIQQVHATIRRKQVYADAEGFAHGTDGMRWNEADWVCFFVVRKYVRVYGAGAPINPNKRLQGQGSRWLFSIGRHPYPDAPQITVQENLRTEAEQAPVWDGLVRLAKQHLVPRLVARYVDGVRAGQKMLLAKELWVDLNGFQSTAISMTWDQVGDIKTQNGAMLIYRKGVQQAQLKYPMSINNAPLVPPVFNAFRRG